MIKLGSCNIQLPFFKTYEASFFTFQINDLGLFGLAVRRSTGKRVIWTDLGSSLFGPQKGVRNLSFMDTVLWLWCFPIKNVFKKQNKKKKKRKNILIEEEPLAELMCLVFTCMPGESYRRQFRSLLLYLCYVFRVPINSLVCWFCMSALGLVLFQICSFSQCVFEYPLKWCTYSAVCGDWEVWGDCVYLSRMKSCTSWMERGWRWTLR